jgi:hypothetical protein
LKEWEIKQLKQHLGSKLETERVSLPVDILNAFQLLREVLCCMPTSFYVKQHHTYLAFVLNETVMKHPVTT